MRRISTASATPTPMPLFAPELRPEWVPLPEGVVPLLPPPVSPDTVVVEGVPDDVDVMVLPLDVKVVTKALVEPPEDAFGRVVPDVAAAELGALEELVLPELKPDPLDGAADADAGEEVGLWPAKN